MKGKESKKIAAAVTAVDLFLKEEIFVDRSETLHVQETSKTSGLTLERKEEMLKEIHGVSTSWSQAGRIQSMNIRNLWQLKIYK